jgi:hypothetical protein
MIMRKFMLPAMLLATATVLGGCQSDNDTLRRAGVGAGVGAAGGAVAGAVIPGVSVGEGAVAGAVAGGVIGAVTADGRRYYWDDRGDCFYVKDDRRVYVERKHCQD